MARLRFLTFRLLERGLARWGYVLRREQNPASEPPPPYREQLALVREQANGFAVIEAYHDDSQPHPIRYIDLECTFASEQIRRFQPAQILDVGSYRHWLIGVMSHWPVITLDVRERAAHLAHETVITEDVLNLSLPSESVDMVISLSTIEHFGLGRYGDQFDLAADAKAIRQMLRVLRPGGHIVFSVPVTQGQPVIAFNAHRIYSLAMVRGWLSDLECVAERFVKKLDAHFIDESAITATFGDWDAYCGCYRKGGA